MNNRAMAWKTGEHFTAYKIYECSNVYQNMIDVMDDSGEMIAVDLADKDFTFILNPSDEFAMSNMEIRDLFNTL